MIPAYHTYHMKIKGMTCTSCVGILRSALLNEEKTIKAVRINLSTDEGWIESSLEPDEVIEKIADVGFEAQLIRPDKHTDKLAYYFKVSKDKDAIISERAADNLRIVWLCQNGVSEVNVDRKLGYARVIIKNDMDITSKLIKSAEDNGIAASLLPAKKEVTYYFSIKGLVSSRDAQQISENLLMHSATVIESNVSYSTSTISVTTRIHEDSKDYRNFLMDIKQIITDTLPERTVSLKRLKSLSKKRQDYEDLAKQYFRRALLNALLALPLILFNSMIPLPFTLVGQMVGLLVGGVTLSVMWNTGKEYYQGAWREFVAGRPANMNTLIALGTGSAWFYSMLMVITPALFPVAAVSYHFLAAAMILTIINFGKACRTKIQEQTKEKIQNLEEIYTKLQPQIAKKVSIELDLEKINSRDYERQLRKSLSTVEYQKIKKGDVIYVEANQRIPVDGIIVHGKTRVEQSIFTGESNECEKYRNEEVISGSLNTRHPIYIRASCDGDKGRLTHIIHAASKASAKGSTVSKTVDKIAAKFAPMVVGISILSAAAWFFWGPAPVLPMMLKTSMSVLLSACSCALGFAVMSVTVGIYRLRNEGVLVNSSESVEALAAVKTVVFDKTGTLTEPKMDNSSIYISPSQFKENNWTAQTVIPYVSSLEEGFINSGGDHPIARLLAAQGSKQSLYSSHDIKKDDQGIRGEVNGRPVVIGNLNHIRQNEIEIPKAYQDKEARYAKSGMTAIYVAIDNQCVALIGLKHNIRNDAKRAVKDLRRLGIKVIMLTGDKKEPALQVANQLNIQNVFYDYNSDEKRKFIEQLQKTGNKVAMIGDGVNDIAATKAAHVGIALGPWTSASASADIALQKLNVARMIIIARETVKNIHQNLAWAGIYNLFTLIAATGLLVPLFGFSLNPVLSSAMMMSSSIIVLFNSSRLPFEIDRRIAIFEGKIDKPATFMQKINHYFSLHTFKQAFNMFVSFYTKSPEKSRRISYYSLASHQGMEPITVADDTSPPNASKSPNYYVHGTKIRVKQEATELPVPDSSALSALDAANEFASESVEFRERRPIARKLDFG